MTRLIKDRFGKWYKENEFYKYVNIFSPAFSTDVFSEQFLIDTGVIAEIRKFEDEPSVVDYLMFDMKIYAIWRYRHLHNCLISEAKAIVDKIQEDLERVKNEKVRTD